jgi:phenylpropionate dioxygenase-like ring-hydroxylating dioxygenase large terminal subunit
MRVTSQPVLRRFWYPVMPVGRLADGPQPFTLLGQDIVLWLDKAGAPSALIDRCCHRTAKLSRGTVGPGGIACGYHGWIYDRDGRCVRMPQLPDREPSDRIRVESFRAAIRYDYVWVCLGEPLTDIPEIPETADPGYRYIHQFYEPWQTSGLRLMENSFDNAHFSFVHPETFGDAEQPIPAKTRIDDARYGFDFHTVVPIRTHPLQKSVLKIDSDETVREVHSTWWMPFMRKFKVTYPSGVIHCIVTSATPMTDGSSMICQFVLRNDSEADAPAAQVNAFDRLVMTEDRTVLEITRPDVPLEPGAAREFSMPSDKPGVLMRRKFLELLTEHGEVEHA